MSQQARLVVAVMTGAALGGVVGYLVLTDQGRRTRAQLEPALDDMLREMHRLAGTVDRARSVVSEGWRLLNQMAGEAGSPNYAPIRQHQPF